MALTMNKRGSVPSAVAAAFIVLLKQPRFFFRFTSPGLNVCGGAMLCYHG